jgi:hypothetical protein
MSERVSLGAAGRQPGVSGDIRWAGYTKVTAASEPGNTSRRRGSARPGLADADRGSAGSRSHAASAALCGKCGRAWWRATRTWCAARAAGAGNDRRSPAGQA